MKIGNLMATTALGGAVGTACAMPVVAYSTLAAATFKAASPNTQMKPLMMLAGGSLLLFGGGGALIGSICEIAAQWMGTSASTAFKDSEGESIPFGIVLGGTGIGAVVGLIGAIATTAFSAIVSTTMKAANPAARYKPFVMLSLGSVFALTAIGATIFGVSAAAIYKLGNSD